MGFFDDIGDWAEGAVDTVGDALGLGEASSPQQHQVDKGSFVDPYSDSTINDLATRRAATDARKAPTMTGTKVAPTQYAYTKQAAPSQQASAASLGPAATTDAAYINRAEDTQGREAQMALLRNLQDEAAGRGAGAQLAGQAYDTANDRNLKNAMALAASRRGNRGNSLATILDSTAADRQAGAQQLAADKLNAQLAARNQLAGLATGMRGQDLDVATVQAGLTDANAARNAAAQNQYGLAQFGALNDFALDNARRADALNQFNAQLASQTGMFNAGQANQMNQFGADLDYKTKASNLEAQLKTMGLNDDMAKYYSSALMDKMEADRAANIAYEQTKAGVAQNYEQMKQNASENAANRGNSTVSSLLGAGGTALAGSDRRIKKNLTDLMEPNEWMFDE